ncbi:MAG: ATP-binding protein [Rubrivivax sp.]|nr:MAG: ATP-binding protein [Rubrivivax sp.]
MTASPSQSDESTRPHFEEDYLLRTIGPIAEDAGMALTELVANAWDAGASLVDLTIPSAVGGTLIVEDDGHGMTADQFRERWMMLGYDRLKRQGVEVEFPALRKGWRRFAYGRSGMGRHGLLCFADRYSVETWRDGQSLRVDIATPESSTPLGIENEVRARRDAQGTQISVAVQRRLPDAGQVRSLLAATFLHDPRFIVRVNGESVAGADLSDSIERIELEIDGGPPVVVRVVDATRDGRGASHAGLSFWVNGRRVGTPSWMIGDESVVNASGRFARRYAVIVQAGEGWLPEVDRHWQQFRRSVAVDSLHLAVRDYVLSAFEQLGKTVADETSEAALMRHREIFGRLSRIRRAEIAAFTRALVKATPAASQDVLSAAVLAAIRIERARGGSGLLDRLAALDDADIGGLQELLSQWSVCDALAVLEEIDQRMAVIATIERLSADPGADELRVLHPLVTQARWLFGPEFESAEYASNVSLRTAAEKVFGNRLPMDAFPNHRLRPDLIVLADATCSVVAREGLEPGDVTASKIRNVLIVELKRGRSTIVSDDLDQAMRYVRGFLDSGALDGSPYYSAFVVGHSIGFKSGRESDIKDGGVLHGHVRAVTYGQLIRSAHQRLFRLKERIPARYEEMTGADLSDRVMRAGAPSRVALIEPDGI